MGSFAECDVIGCVYLTCFRPEFDVLSLLTVYSGIKLHRAETLEEADFLLTVTDSTVVLTDLVFLDGRWKDALSMVQSFHPMLTALVVGDDVDRDALSEARAQGACGTLERPIGLSNLVRTIRRAHEIVCERASV